MTNEKKSLVLNKDLLEFIFEAAHIQRWNDHIRPQGFTELDKQAHKMMILYILARYEEKEHGAKLDWQVLIEGGIFELFHRIVLTDIKPPVFHELMRRSGPDLNKWVYEELTTRVPSLAGTEFFKRMQVYFNEEQNLKEKKILRAAHYLATEWEFRIVYHLNQGMYGLEETKRAIASELEDHYDLAGVQKIALGCKTRNFIDFIGQLRFQKRWSQSPRVPETSVMGHVLVVAVLSYFCTLHMGACKQRLVNDFLGGLWHDLPEVLTRDIISPVKRSVKGLDEMIKEIEKRQVEERILPLLPVEWHQDIINFTTNEFTNRVVLNQEIRTLQEDIPDKYNKDQYNAVDGQLLKGCDHLAAFMEAWLSIEYGITSKHLECAVVQLREDYAGRIIAGIPFGEIYKQFP
ncbi:MAG: HD domain-containing protein [Acidaminococcaceae bacterium]|nr:HD domain-containing protein [Acidaminococcaceae bacterium]MDD4722333.1 HD domain-containing protein [Acidaminococcaceae bacterium]